MNAVNIEILKVLVGSHAHGLASKDSDFDYRGVFVTPTSELLKLGGNTKTTNWVEGEEDNTSYEISHFLHLATKSNPSILECFTAPAVPYTVTNEKGYLIHIPEIRQAVFGKELRDLFPYVWSSKGVFEAFKGYSHNQHKKMFSEKEEFAKRKFKYAVAHLRVLLQGIELLSTGDFHVEIQYSYPNTPDPYVESFYFDGWADFLRAIREEQISTGEIVDTAEELKEVLKAAYEANPDKQTDLEPVNEFLLKVRKEFW